MEYLNRKVFDQEIRGFLFFMQPLLDGTERAKLVFEYAPEALQKLREGDIVGVESFSTLTPQGNGKKYYTLLEITKISPTHITIDRLKKYRFMGAVREFLKESTKDFEQDDPRLIRDHVYIEADAEPTGHLMSISEDGYTEFTEEPSKPILGRDVGVLNTEAMKGLVNRGIDEGIEIGNLYKKEIPVFLKPWKLITHHYSVFGFTGAGKSNFNSVVVTRLLQKANLKIIVFDLSDEYTNLMIDQIAAHGFIVIDEEDVHESLVEYLGDEKRSSERLHEAATDLAKTSKKPGVFDSEDFVRVYEELYEEILEKGKIKIFSPKLFAVTKKIETVQDFIAELEDRVTWETDTKYLKNMVDLLPKVAEEIGIAPVQNLAEWKISQIPDFEQFIDMLRRKAKVSERSGFFASIDAVLAKIKYAQEIDLSKIPKHFANIDWVLEKFVAQKEGDKLCVLISSNKENLMSMMMELIALSLNLRRKITKSHDVLFVVDEAHEFVLGGSARPSAEEQRCSTMIERLTRMGRKYGLGACISSQRVSYLNTTAISNCHTVFLGCLPRLYDRNTVRDAYGVSEDMLNQVVRFPPGHWYALSSVAMGVNNVPVRIEAPNRETELANFFKQKRYLNKGTEKVLKDIG